MTTRQTRFILTLMTSVLAVSLTACGNKNDKKSANQVAAKVGSEEISIHQINQVLSRTKIADSTPEAVQAMSQEVLEKLIDQQLAVNQALEAKLNRSPEVVSQLESSRLDILARSHLQKIASAVPKPSPDELKKYFTEHPQLFSERRIFNVQEIVVATTPGVAEQLRSNAAASKPIEETAIWLKGQDIKFGGGSSSRPAEQIPLELLGKIHALKDGQSLVTVDPQTITLLRIASSQLSPVTKEIALPRIEQFLMNQRAAEAVAANIKQLRADTKITYMGAFAKAENTGVDTPIPVPPVKPSAVSANTTLEKGVAGLK